ncbi:glycosyltransferase [Nanoarchaeota archaeon]
MKLLKKLKRKRIVISSDTYFPMVDGVTRFINEVAPKLNDDYEIIIIAPKFKKNVERKFNTLFCPTIKLFSVAGYPAAIPKLFKMYKVIKEAKLVFVQSGPFIGGASVLLARLLKKPVVMYMHQISWEQLSAIARGPDWFKNMVRRFSVWYTRFFANRCHVLMVPNEEVVKKLEDNGVYKEKVIIPLGINVKKFVPSEDKVLSKKKIGINSKKIVIGYCGRISYEKDVDTLLKAFKRLKQRIKNVFLLIVGDGNDEIKDRIKMTKNTMITGFVNDVIPYYQAMDIYVLPSLTETTGLTILEAMSCELPVMTTPVGFAISNIDKNENGILFPKTSVEVLTTKLEELVKNAKLREYIARGGRLTIEREFTWEKTAEKIKKEFNKFLDV